MVLLQLALTGAAVLMFDDDALLSPPPQPDVTRVVKSSEMTAGEVNFRCLNVIGSLGFCIPQVDSQLLR